MLFKLYSYKMDNLSKLRKEFCLVDLDRGHHLHMYGHQINTKCLPFGINYSINIPLNLNTSTLPIWPSTLVLEQVLPNIKTNE